MDFIYWVLFAIFLWIVGYFMTRLSIRKNLENEAFILAPEWLYILCGKPNVTNIPAGALSVRGITFQLTGILMVIIVLIVKVMELNGLDFLQEYYIGIWLGCLFLGIIISLLLKKIIPLTQESNIIKSE